MHLQRRRVMQHTYKACSLDNVAIVQVLDDNGASTGETRTVFTQTRYKPEFKPWHPVPYFEAVVLQEAEEGEVAEIPAPDLPAVNELIVFVVEDGLIERWAYEQEWKVAEALTFNPSRYRLVQLRDGKVVKVLWQVKTDIATPPWQQIFAMSQDLPKAFDELDAISLTYRFGDPHGRRFQEWKRGAWHFTDDIRVPYAYMVTHSEK